MPSDDHFGERKGRSGGSETETSFHGWLLDRSKTDLPDYTGREKLTWLAEQWGWRGPILGGGALGIGGLSIGAGVLLQGDFGITANRALLLILGGVAGLLVGILALLTQWLISRWSAEEIRG